MTESFMTSIKKILLGEDAGVSSDAVSTNNVGSGKVAAVGVPSDGEPGGTARRKRRIAKARNPRLFRDLAKGGEINLAHYKEDAVELLRYASKLSFRCRATYVR